MLLDQVSGEPGSGGEVAGFDCFDPGGRNWVAGGLVQIFDNIVLFAEFVDIVGQMVAWWIRWFK